MADELKDVAVSIMKRIDGQLSSTAYVRWPGTAFRADAASASGDKWFEPHLAMDAEPTRDHRRRETWSIVINCFAKSGGVDSFHGVWELADAIRAAFDQVTHSIQDWSEAGDPVLHYIRWGEIDVGPFIPPRALEAETGIKNLQQLPVTVEGSLFV